MNQTLNNSPTPREGRPLPNVGRAHDEILDIGKIIYLFSE